jgi:hypothetical protein
VSLDSSAIYYKINGQIIFLSGPKMSKINALAHHIDQLLTQHRTLQQDYVHLQSHVKELEQQLLGQQLSANTLLQAKNLASEQAYDPSMEDELNHLIGLFDQVTEAHND